MKNLNLSVSTSPAELEDGDLCLPVSVPTLKKCPFCCLFSATFLAFLRFLLVTLLFKKVPMLSAEVLSVAPKGKKAVMCALEKTLCVC